MSPALLLHFEDEAEHARRLAQATGLRTALITRHRFPDGEIKLRLPAQAHAPWPAHAVILRSLVTPMKSWLNCCWPHKRRASWAPLGSHSSPPT